MPLVVKELYVRVAVNPQGGQAGDQAGTTAGTGSSDGNQVDQEAIIAACIEQVMEILQEKTEA